MKALTSTKISQLLNDAIDKTKKERIAVAKSAMDNLDLILKSKPKINEKFREKHRSLINNLLSKYIEGNHQIRQEACGLFVKVYDCLYIIAYYKSESRINKSLKILEEIIKNIDEKVRDTSTDSGNENVDGIDHFALCDKGNSDSISKTAKLKIHIFKPAQDDFDSSENSSFSPDFVAFLRKRSKQYLLTFYAYQVYINNNPNESSNTISLIDSYRTELQIEIDKFEEETFKSIYCKPRNLAMPGMQSGYRLLKLPTLFNDDDYRKNEIYQGQNRNKNYPDVDYEELIRRYINSFELKPVNVYLLDSITDNYIEQFYQDLINVYNPDKILLFKTATQIILNSSTFKEYIEQNIDKGNDLSNEELKNWLLNIDDEKVLSLKNNITTKWKEFLPSLSENYFSALPVPQDFKYLFAGLCLPNKSTNPNDFNAGSCYFNPSELGWTQSQRYIWTLNDIESLLFSEKNPGTEDEKGKLFATEVFKRINALVDLYDKLWKFVKELVSVEKFTELSLNDIKYSGYEFKCTVNWLAYNTLKLLNGYHYNGSFYNGNGFDTGTETNTDAANYLKNIFIEPQNLSISETEIASIVKANSNIPFDINDFYIVNTNNLQDYIITFLSSIESSYATLRDIYFSQLPASFSATSILVETDRIYEKWAENFLSFLSKHSYSKNIAKNNKYYLRLTPKMGKYGEIPNPKTVNENLDLNNISSTHPRIQTENYMLESIPKYYACNSSPSLYLKQDLTLRTKHVGYGIGANLYSMSLLPEEEQVITVKSFKDTKISTSESTAENIFEEAGSETSKDFAREMKHESERESSNQEDFSISGKASAKWGWGSASVESGYSSKSDDRTLAKNASSCTNRLASKLSAKRTVSIDTQRTTNKEVDIHSELVTERKVKNPNKGHTLTFHWFQMTRKLMTELVLDDIKLVYSSGVHNKVVVYGNGKCPTDVDDKDFFNLPGDLASKLAPNSVIAIYNEPYTENISMANANAFLIRVLNENKAFEISTSLWKILGVGDAAPEGYGILAYPSLDMKQVQNQRYISLYLKDKTIVPSDSMHEEGEGEEELNNETSDNTELDESVTNKTIITSEYVASDDIYINDEREQPKFYLPNIDIRYKRQPGLAPTRYSADEFNNYSLPRVLLREPHVINTNGVYCDAMVGRCTALEDYLQRHRDLDLLEKKLEIGSKELDFKWALEKDGLDVIVSEQGDTISGIVKEKQNGQAFKTKKELEEKKRTEDIEIANAKLKLEKLVKELALLDAKITKEGLRPDYKFDVPEGTNLSINTCIENNEQ